MADSNGRTAIIVALIGLIGAIAAAVIGNWQVFFSSNTRLESPPPVKGWIWLGAIFKSSGNVNSGEEIHSLGRRQPITITPSLVPTIGSTVTIINSVNIRKCPPLPPDYKLCEKIAGKIDYFSPGTEIVVDKINTFVDKKTDPTYTRVWAKVESKN